MLYIVIPVINCLDYTKDCIASIKSNEPHKVILIDNNSNDGTKEWAQTQNLIYVFNEQRKSVSASWNQGVKIALEDPECKYIAILNNDILLHENTLNNLMAFMDHTGYILVTGDNIKGRYANNKEEALKYLGDTKTVAPFTDFDTWNISDWRAEGPDFSCYMINRTTIELIGWFDEHFEGAYCEDWDYHARIGRAREWAKNYGDQIIPSEKIHAKRLSTAPYFHYASQTLAKNEHLRGDISSHHGRNRNYYTEKWGGDHEFVMDGHGNVTPFGDATKNWRMW